MMQMVPMKSTEIAAKPVRLSDSHNSSDTKSCLTVRNSSAFKVEIDPSVLFTDVAELIMLKQAKVAAVTETF